MQIWTLAVYGPEQPLTTTVHNTEDECFESLREPYDDRTHMPDDEAPVDIVELLELGEQQLHIEIDVHEVSSTTASAV